MSSFLRCDYIKRQKNLSCDLVIFIEQTLVYHHELSLSNCCTCLSE